MRGLIQQVGLPGSTNIFSRDMPGFRTDHALLAGINEISGEGVTYASVNRNFVPPPNVTYSVQILIRVKSLILRKFRVTFSSGY